MLRGKRIGNELTAVLCPDGFAAADLGWNRREAKFEIRIRALPVAHIRKNACLLHGSESVRDSRFRREPGEIGSRPTKIGAAPILFTLCAIRKSDAAIKRKSLITCE